MLSWHVNLEDSLREKKILEKDKIIFFKTTYRKSGELKLLKNSNIFMEMRSLQKAKVLQVINLIEQINDRDSVFFIHDGKKRLASPIFEEQFKNLDINNFKKFSFSEFANIDKEHNYEELLSQLKEECFKVAAKVKDNDVVILDGTRADAYCFIDYFNSHFNNIALMILANGNIDGKFKEINFPLIEIKNKQNISATLDLQDIISRLSFKLNSTQKSLLLEKSYRLDYPLLLKYASDKVASSISNKKELVEQITKSLNNIDGEQDIFVGLRNITAFKDNVNIYRESNSFIFPKSLNSFDSFNKIFFHTQFIPINNDIFKTDVNTMSIDVLRITNINISDGTWGCEFYLNITTKHKDPIKFLIFNNLSMLNDKFESKLIEFTESESSGSYNYEYYIIANFDFEPIADNYPFDWQHLYIAYSISDEKKYGIIQPIPDKLLDIDFKVEGWKFRNAVTGLKRKKLDKYVDYNLIQKVSVEETARVGWTLSRANYITLTKIAIPLLFLLFLNYYALFFTFDSALRQIGILTTTFLSGIALYFSAERPQPLRLTTIDLIFIWYYVQSGIVIVTSAISSQLGEKSFNIAMDMLKFEAPVGLIALIVFLFYRIKAVRLRPNIS